MLVEIVEALTQLVEDVVMRFGLVGVTLVAFGENLFPPTPSELLYPLAGKMAYEGKLTPLGIVLAGVLGSLMGSLIYYGIGYRLGEERVRRAIIRFGTVRLFGMGIEIVALEDYERALALFERYGGRIVLLARIMPLVHGVVSIPAGVIKMRLGSFLLYTSIGSALWIAPLTLLGYWLGSQWEKVLRWMEVYENVWYVVMVLALIYIIYRRFWVKRRQALEMIEADFSMGEESGIES